MRLTSDTADNETGRKNKTTLERVLASLKQNQEVNIVHMTESINLLDEEKHPRHEIIIYVTPKELVIQSEKSFTGKEAQVRLQSFMMNLLSQEISEGYSYSDVQEHQAYEPGKEFQFYSYLEGRLCFAEVIGKDTRKTLRIREVTDPYLRNKEKLLEGLGFTDAQRETLEDKTTSHLFREISICVFQYEQAVWEVLRRERR